MIKFVDLSLYTRELVGVFGGKMKCQRYNINVIIIDFLGHGGFTVRGVI